MFASFTTDNNELNYPLIGIITVFVLLALIMIYYVIMDYNKSGSVTTTSKLPATLPQPNATVANVSQPAPVPGLNTLDTSAPAGASQVFNVSDNIFAYDDAEAVCKAYGADLATYDQVVEAYKQGANWCNYGWTKGQLALFPVQKAFWDKVQENEPERQGECGVPGINGGYFDNKHQQFGVNCYGQKRAPRTDESMKKAYMSDKERALQEKIFNFKRQLGTFKLTPFNEEKWGSC